MDYRKIYNGSIQRTTLSLMLYGLPTLDEKRVFLEDIDSLNNMAILINKLANHLSSDFNAESISRLIDSIKNGDAARMGYKKKIELFYYPESNELYPMPTDNQLEESGQLRMVI